MRSKMENLFTMLYVEKKVYIPSTLKMGQCNFLGQRDNRTSSKSCRDGLGQPVKIWDRTVRDFDCCTVLSRLTKRDKAEKDVLKQEKNILEQGKDLLKQKRTF